MTRQFARLFLAVLGMTAGGAALANDAAIITMVKGRATLEQANPVPVSATALMKLRTGDWLVLADNSTAQVVYFANGRQETWQGATRVQVGSEEGRSQQQAMEVKQLPMLLVRQLSSTPAAAPSGRVGAVRMRNIAPPEAQAALETNYRELRAQAPAQDRTPELYYLAGLYELRDFARIEKLTTEWTRDHPDDATLRALADHYASALRGVKR